MSDVLNRDLLDGIYLDFTFLHPVPPAHRDLRPRPDANATGDRPAPYTFPKTLSENHEEMAVTAPLRGSNSARERVASGSRPSQRCPFPYRRFQPLSRPCFVSRRSANRTRPTRFRR